MQFEVWPTNYRLVTQPFGANPAAYQRFGLPGHEGIDLRAPYGSPYYAVAAGEVIWVSDQRRSGGASAYGWHIIIDHGAGWSTLYAHAAPDVPVTVGQRVVPGQIVGFSGNTGNSSGPHLHLTLKHSASKLPGWPRGYVDPTPFLLGVPMVGPYDVLLAEEEE